MDIAGDRALGHYTHEKSPVGCAAALATISVIEEEGLLEHVRDLGAWTLAQLGAMQKRQPVIRRVEGMGLMIGVTVGDGRQSVALAEDVMYRALASGLNFKLTMGTTIQLMPALTITQEQMQHALNILEMSIAAAANQVTE